MTRPFAGAYPSRPELQRCLDCPNPTSHALYEGIHKGTLSSDSCVSQWHPDMHSNAGIVPRDLTDTAGSRSKRRCPDDVHVSMDWTLPHRVRCTLALANPK